MWNRFHRVLMIFLVAVWLPAFAQIKVEIVTDEADAVLTILAKSNGGQKIEETDWKRLFQSEGYLRLVAREAQFRNPMDEGAFKEFVLGKELQDKAPALSHTLKAWCSVDMATCAQRALAYLPEGASIKAHIYPVIKPRSNSFVFQGKSIFLFIDPSETKEQFENTLIHELHHIGLNSVKPDPAMVAELEELPEQVQVANDWVGCFGEGFAMLAAAGSPRIHPHANSNAEDRKRWDLDLANFDNDLKKVEAFLIEVAEGRLKGAKASARGSEFFGIQGPWYTVGWRMASTIEQELGKPVLLACMKDTRKLLPTFNEAAAKAKLTCATWSPILLERLAGEDVRLTLKNSQNKPITVTVSGVVRDKASSRPIQNASVRAHIIIGTVPIKKYPYQETITDAAGQYQLTFVTNLIGSGMTQEKNGLCVYVSCSGYESAPRYAETNVTDKNATFKMDFAPAPGKHLRGVVVNQAGRPVSGAVVRVQNSMNGDWNHFGALGRVETAVDGSFQLWVGATALSGGRAWLDIGKPDIGTLTVNIINSKEDLGMLQLEPE
jgi:hypothetical protein